MAKRLEILVIEDSEPCARILEISLGERGHLVKIASTLDAALFALSAESFDAIICDLLLPDGNGCEIMPHILARKDAVFAVAVSGLGGPQVAADALDAGFNGFLRKPFKPLDAAAMIEAARC